MENKFDFSKAEDQDKFEKLHSKEKQKIINEAYDELAEIKRIAEKRRSADYEKTAKRIEAQKNWSRGHLGVTAEDHFLIGSTPDSELLHNPGKTLGEIWDKEKISKKIEGWIAFLEKARKEYKEKGPNNFNSQWLRDDILYTKKRIAICNILFKFNWKATG